MDTTSLFSCIAVSAIRAATATRALSITPKVASNVEMRTMAARLNWNVTILAMKPPTPAARAKAIALSGTLKRLTVVPRISIATTAHTISV